jgi:hypothetical protein
VIKYRIFLFFLSLGNVLIAQSIRFNEAFPIHPYTDSWSFSVQNAPSGYIIYGITVDSNNHQDPAIVKIDSVGNLLWQRTYPKNGFDFIPLRVPNELGIITSSGDEVGVVNWVNDTSLSYAYWSLYHFNNIGDTIWTRNYHDSSGIVLDQIKASREKQYLIYGEWFNYVNMYYVTTTLVLIKTDTLGNKIWTKTYYAATNHERIPTGIDTSKDGGYILCAYDYDTIQNYSKLACRGGEIMVMKTDSSGNTQWIKYIANPLCDVSGYSIRTLKNGGYIICGWWGDSLSDHNQIGYSDLYIVKVNDTGGIVWSKQYGIPVTDEGNASLVNLKELPDGDLITCGNGDTSVIGCILRTDSNGNQKWLKYYTKFSPNDVDYLTDIQLTSDGGIISSGYTYASPSYIWVVKTDSLGCDTIGCDYTGIEQLKENEEEVMVYPNPNNGQFTLTLLNLNGKCNIEIYNVLGEKIYTEALQPQDNNTLDLTDQPNGIYFYRVLKEDGGLVGSGKVVIEK